MISSAHKTTRLAFLLAGCFVVSVPAQALDTANMTLDQRLNRLERTTNNQNFNEMLFTIERLQQEVDGLRGELDEARHELDVLKRQQKDLYLDLDQRMQHIEMGGGAAASSMPADAAAGFPDVAAPLAVPGVAAGDASAAPAGDAGQAELSYDEAGLYQKAFSQLKEGRYQEAALTFQLFLQTYPQGVYTDNAQYWLGEVHYVMRNFRAAIAEFEKVIAQFPNSSKVPDAHLKMGFSYYELQDWVKAKQSLMLVVQRYPASSASRLAERRIQQMKLEGRI